MNLLERYPRQLGLFVLGVIVLGCYMLALVLKLDTTVLVVLISNVIGGLIAELTGQRQAQHIDIEKVQHAEMNTGTDKAT